MDSINLASAPIKNPLSTRYYFPMELHDMFTNVPFFVPLDINIFFASGRNHLHQDTAYPGAVGAESIS